MVTYSPLIFKKLSSTLLSIEILQEKLHTSKDALSTKLLNTSKDNALMLSHFHDMNVRCKVFLYLCQTSEMVS